MNPSKEKSRGTLRFHGRRILRRQDGNNKSEVINVTSDELHNIDNALSQAKSLYLQLRDAERSLQDAQLKQKVQQMAKKASYMYDVFYNLV